MKVLSYDELSGKGIRHSRSTLWRLVKAGKFPKPIQLSEQRVAFVEAEIDAWLKAKVAERDGLAA